jgi:hypothetical protein
MSCLDAGIDGIVSIINEHGALGGDEVPRLKEERARSLAVFWVGVDVKDIAATKVHEHCAFVKCVLPRALLHHHLGQKRQLLETRAALLGPPPLLQSILCT